MTDIVERLRWVARNCDQPICEEAADTIEGFLAILKDVDFYAHSSEQFSPALRDRIAEELDAWEPPIKTVILDPNAPLSAEQTIEDMQRDIDAYNERALKRQDWIGG